MKKIILIILVLGIILSGCIGGGEEEECPEAEPCAELDCTECGTELTCPECSTECPACPECEKCTATEKEIVKYTCPNGIIVENNSDCINSASGGESESFSTEKIIDEVYLLDSNTSEKPIGSAVVVGKTYAIIAKDEEKFTEPVTFMLVVDGEIIDSAEVTCPEYCTDETMYYTSFEASEGEYNNIQILVEDGSGAKGESIIYEFVNSISEAEYLAETCELEEEVEEYECFEDEISAKYYGGTITEGWSAGAVINPYDAGGNYSKVCNDLSETAYYAGIPDGHLAFTFCKLGFKSCPYIEHKEINEETCTCTCTVNITDVEVSLDSRVQIPNWKNYSSGTSCQKERWDNFMQGIKIHEEGHLELCRQEKTDIENAVKGISVSAEGRTCPEACDEAVKKAKAERANKANVEVQEAHKTQEKYDDDTMNGINQGAFIDCSDCD